MRASMYFYGCSCGCTPSESKTINAVSREDLIKGVADFHRDYETVGSNRFRKVSLRNQDADPDGDKEFLKDVYTFLDKVEIIDKKIEKADNIVWKEWVSPFTARNGFELTEEQKNINQCERIVFDSEKEKAAKEVRKLRSEVETLFQGDWEYEYEPECEDED